MTINETIETNIRQFFIEWELWAKLGGIGDEFQQIGLCGNLELWVNANEETCKLEGVDVFAMPAMYRSVLHSLIIDAGYESLAFPFDAKGYDYFRSLDNETIHLNPSRLGFVRDQIKCMV